MRKHFLHTFVCVAMSLSFWACEYKDTLDVEITGNNSVQVNFDWGLVDSIPKTFRLMFYPGDQETADRLVVGYRIFDVCNSSVLLHDISAGCYDVTAWNTDVDYNVTDEHWNRWKLNMSTQTYYESTISPILLDSLFDRQTVVMTPDYVLHANVDRFHIVRDKEKQQLTLRPDSMVITVSLKINGVEGLQLAKKICGTLTNVGKKRLIAYENCVQDSAVVIFNCKWDKEKKVVYSKFHLFGLRPAGVGVNDQEHILTLFFWLQGKNVYIPIDLTELVNRHSNNESLVNLEIKDLHINLNDYVDVPGMFDVIVDDWTEGEHHDVNW